MKKYHVYALGNALVDMEFEVDDKFLNDNNVEKGVMTLVEEDRQHELMCQLDAFDGNKASGGSAANTIIAVAAFGGNSFYSCRVSNDDLGDFYMHDLHAAGVDSNLNSNRPEGTTGKCLVMVTDDAERTMNSFLGISATLDSGDLDKDAIRNSDYLYMEGYLVSSPTGKQATLDARKIAQEAGVKIALTFSDPAMVQFFHDGLQEMVGDGVDLLFCNEDEAMAYTKKDTVEAAIDALKPVAKTFAVTLGSKGALLFDGKKEIHIEPNAVTAIDSNGAGDMFAGAFLYAITHGKSYEEAGKLASLASSKVVSQFGPRLPLEEHGFLLEMV
ncbi:MAG TPA: adenosine kinase [Gammaproteobacteria bacterium]|nr:adenosine kinase [Gammaproteobacteria bacterium]